MDGFAGSLGVRSTHAADGEAHLELDADERHLNPAGTVHGGVLATLLDTAMGEAVRTTRDDVPATSQLTVTYLRPAHPGPLTITGQVGKQGSHLVICTAEANQDGKTVAAALATFAITPTDWHQTQGDFRPYPPPGPTSHKGDPPPEPASHKR